MACHLAKGAFSLWQEEPPSDYTIEVEDIQFKVHKVVMTAVSDYFKVMLTGGMMESQTNRVRLKGLSSLVVSNIIGFIYTGEFGCPKAGTEELLGAAVYLQIQSAIKACTDLLYDEVNVENCLHILSTFKTYSVEDGIKRTTRYIQANMDEILQTCKVAKLSFSEFLNFMDCWNKYEFELFQLAEQWLREEFDNRKEHANQIMGQIRFSLIAPHNIAEIKDHEIFSVCEGPWHEQVEQAQTYQNLPIHQKVLNLSEQSRLRIEPSPVWFPLDYFRDPNQIYVLREGKSSEYTWEPVKSTNGPEFQERPNFLEVNNFLITNDGKRGWYILDPQTFKWSTMASMDKTREGFALVFHQNHLYALGGTIPIDEAGLPADVLPRPKLDYRNIPTDTVAVDLIERYDFQTDTWSVVSSKLPEQLDFPDAFSIGGYIYVVFGWIYKTGTSQCSDGVSSLDLNTSTWSKKASAPKASNLLHEIQLMKLQGEQVIASFDMEQNLHYYKPSTDQWSVYNLSQTSQLYWAVPKSRVCTTGDTVFFLDFDKAIGSIDTAGYEHPWTTGVCEKWTLGDEGPKFETSLEEVPFGSTVQLPGLGFSCNCYFALLAVALPSV